MTKDQIVNASNDSFLQYVNDDLRVNDDVEQSDKEVYEALRSPEGIDRWLNALKSIKRNIESQLANDFAWRKEKQLEFAKKGMSEENRIKWLEYLSKRERWRADSIRVKNKVENMIDEATRLRNKMDTSYRAAIIEHMDAILNDPDNSDVIDNKLWETVK